MTREQEIIKNEITTDPLGIGYASMTDQQVADSLNSKIYDRAKPGIELTKALLVKVLGLTRVAQIIDALRANITNGDTESELALEFISSGVDLNDPTTQALIDTFVTKGVITAAEASSIKAIGVEKVSRVQVLGVNNTVPVTWITDIRKGGV